MPTVAKRCTKTKDETMKSVHISLVLFLLFLQSPAFGQQWHSLENQGIVVEEMQTNAPTSNLPTSPGEVIVWSNESAVVAELQREYGSLTQSDSYVLNQGASGITSDTIEQRYTSQRPILYMDTAEGQTWSTRSGNAPMPITSSQPFNTQPHAHPHTQPHAQPHMHRPTGVLPWLREMEYRKNLWLQRTFGS